MNIIEELKTIEKLLIDGLDNSLIQEALQRLQTLIERLEK